MITEDKLLEALKKENLYAFKTLSDFDYKKYILLESESIEELIQFAKLNNINSVFYDYVYYNEDNYKFDLEEVELCVDNSIFKLIKKDIVAHNKKIDKIDFSIPKGAIIYAIYQSQKVGILILNSWLEDDEEILETEYQLEYLLEKYEDVLFEKQQKEQEKLDKLKKEFEDFLLADKEFLSCTNQNMRTHYMNAIIDKDNTKKYMKAFKKTNRVGSDVIDRNSLWVHIETVWRKYKSNTKK